MDQQMTQEKQSGGRDLFSAQEVLVDNTRTCCTDTYIQLAIAVNVCICLYTFKYMISSGDPMEVSQECELRDPHKTH